MTRPLCARLRWAVPGLWLLAVAALGWPGPAVAQEVDPPDPARPAAPADTQPGRFFVVEGQITNATTERLQDATRQLVDRTAARGSEPILIFEIKPGDDPPGATSYGSAFDLAEFLSTGLGGAKLTVAYVPVPLSGYAVLAALACDEIVMGPGAALGPITPEGQRVRREARDYLRQTLAPRKGRDPDLLVGLLDPNADLRRVTTGDRQVHYVLAENLPEFERRHQVVQHEPAWEGGRRSVLTAQQAREGGFSKLTAETREEVANVYRLSPRAITADPTLGEALIQPVWIQIEGVLDATKAAYISRRVQQARREKVNLIFFEINSRGGLDDPADRIAKLISDTTDMKTVAYINDRAEGVATLVALACDDIVFRDESQMGGLDKLVVSRTGRTQELSARQQQALAQRAVFLAERVGHPAAVARAMVDPEAVVLQARDLRSGAVVFLTPEQQEADPERYADVEVRKRAGRVLTVSATEAQSYGLGLIVADNEELKGLYDLRGQDIRVTGPTWVDTLVTTLNTPWMSWMLLFIGLFMLILELKLPGIGLPAILSALAFLLFFWGRYLSGTADQLEIMLFLVGLICLALELFVFPGFGVFGMSGILLVLISVVMASHTFVWPTQAYEYRQMGLTLLQVVVTLLAVGVGAVILGRYYPSLPLFRRLVLEPEPWTGPGPDHPLAKPVLEGETSFTFLLGETGRCTTVLRPTGKARFGELLVDVIADGDYIEPNSRVEVVEVHGSRVIVKKVGA